MKFTCYTNELTRALDIVGRALASRPVLKAYENIAVEATKIGTVTLRTTDGAMYMSASVEAHVAEPGEIALDGRTFADCVRKQNGEEIALQTNKAEAVIQCGRSKTQIALQDLDNAPGKPKQKDTVAEATIPGDKLRACIDYVAFAVSRDETRRILTGILLEITEGKLRTVGLDGFRLAKMETACAYTDVSIKAVVPLTAALALAKLMRDDTEVAIAYDGLYLTASVNSTEMAVLTIQGEFIDWRRIVPTESTVRAKLDASDLRSCAERAQIMANRGNNNLVRLTFNQNCVAVTSRSDMGGVYDEADCELDGDDMRIAFNCTYLMDALKAEAGNQIELGMTTSGRACVIRCADSGKDTLQLLLPVRELG